MGRPADLHLWFKCQESSPLLMRTVVVLWIQRHPRSWTSPCCHSGGDPGPIAELFSSSSSNQDLVYQSLETAPSVAWRQCAISYGILRPTVYACKVFLDEKQNVNLILFNYWAKIRCLRNSVTVYIGVNTKTGSPIFLWGRSEHI